MAGLACGGRWSIYDNCQCLCTGRARDWLPGSFVYCKDNTLAGPPLIRGACFPKLGEREELWRQGAWNAMYLCRTCLVKQWHKTPADITEWQALNHGGGAKATSIQRRQQMRAQFAKGQGKGWHDHGWDYHPYGQWWGGYQGWQ